MKCHTPAWLLACALAVAVLPQAFAADRLRLIIETDAGGDPDDEQSLVRFLHYVNEWDVEGIIANRPTTRDGENLNAERSGYGVVRRLVQAYGKCWTNLVQHDGRYPAPNDLLARAVAGYDETDAAVNLLIAAVDMTDPRPLWYSDWGSDQGCATNNLRRALDKVLRERGTAGYARFKNRLRIVSYPATYGPHTTNVGPPFPLLVDTFRPPLEGKRWYHRFSALTATAGGFDLRRDVLTGHGPLGALYPTNTTHWQKEGDTMAFLYLVPTGMNDPTEPTWGSWAGRYGLNPEFGDRRYYWANQSDAWKGSAHRENTLKRWAEHLQNDFRARLDWCVKPRGEANHPPQVRLNGVEGDSILRWHARTGESLRLDARGSTDPDGDALRFEWVVYPEAAGEAAYSKSVRIDGETLPIANVRVPTDAADRQVHFLVAVTDAGSPPLTRYRRAVIDVSDAESASRTIEPFFSPPESLAGQVGQYRSPLLFNSGPRVNNAAEWQRRRAEILHEWTGLMGSWPPLIRKPKVEVIGSSRRDNFSQMRVRLDIAPGQTAEGWLSVPDGNGPRPAALVVYYEPETSIGLNADQPLRDFGLQLARRGFVTLNIGTPGGNARTPNIGDAVCQPLSFHAYVAANCWQALANLPEVDASRIGVLGHSYGGKWAMFAGALWDKFACVAVSDPGIVFDESRPNVNYWEPWYLGLDPKEKRLKAGVPTADNPRTGAYKRMFEAGRDLHELHALIAPRPLLVSGGSEDPASRWTALNHLLEVNRVLGFSNRVAMTTRKEHSPSERSNEQIYAFFERFLK